MSYESWQDEFYPVPANEVPEGKALAHSLQKWIGLRQENLEKHGVTLSPGFRMVHEPGHADGLGIDDESCALCAYYATKDLDGEAVCDECPIKKHTGQACGWTGSAWLDFAMFGNPEPMIEALRGALAKEGA